MSEYDEDDLDQDVEEVPEEVASSATDDKVLEKLRKENHSLRSRLRRSELEAEFGSDVAALVPDALPLKEWKEYAGKLVALKGPAVSTADQTDEATQEAPSEEPSEVERRLATVGKVSPPGAALPEELLTVAQIKELSKTDPEGAERLIMEGKFQQQANW